MATIHLVVVVREGKNFKGRMLELAVGVIGKRVLEKQLGKTLRAIEARNADSAVLPSGHG